MHFNNLVSIFLAVSWVIFVVPFKCKRKLKNFGRSCTHAALPIALRNCNFSHKVFFATVAFLCKTGIRTSVSMFRKFANFTKIVEICFNVCKRRVIAGCICKANSSAKDSGKCVLKMLRTLYTRHWSNSFVKNFKN